jgi:hypothetical protein
MLKTTLMFRVLIGLMLLASVTLSACATQTRADTDPTGEPSLLDPPAVEGGEGVYIDSVEVLILESWPVQFVALVRGHLADGCTTIEEIRVGRTAEANRFEITIVTARDPEAMCTMALVPFEESVELSIDGLPAGTYEVEAHGVSAEFELPANNGAVDEPAGEGLYIDELMVMLMESLPATGAVIVRGNLADGCTQIVDMLVEFHEGSDLFKVTLGTYRDPDAMCTMALVPVEEVISLPIEGLSAGTYTVEVNGMTTTFELAVDNVFVE